MIVTAIYLFGFTGAKVGAYTLLETVLGSHVVLVEIVASILMIVAFDLAPDSFRRPLSGRFAELIGALSFPLYLVHVLVLCSFGCAMLILSQSWATGAYPNIIAVAATISGSVLVAVPLVYFNESWVKLVNIATNWLLSPTPSAVLIEQKSMADLTE